jgi:hypothetical protein
MNAAEFYLGTWGTVSLAIEASGACPARVFIEELSTADKAKLFALLKRAADMGPMNINNREKFKKLDDDLYEFKVFQIRIPCFYNGRSIVLTHGFKKKQDDIPPGELLRAKRIRAESRGVDPTNAPQKNVGKSARNRKK